MNFFKKSLHKHTFYLTHIEGFYKIVPYCDCGIACMDRMHYDKHHKCDRYIQAKLTVEVDGS